MTRQMTRPALHSGFGLSDYSNISLTERRSPLKAKSVDE
jgi:hypothetical protein